MTTTLIGVSPIMHSVYLGEDVKPLWDMLVARVTSDPKDAAALMDLSVLLQARGQRAKGLELQRDAIAIQPAFHRTFGTGGGLKVAALVTAGDLMANTPIDFLLEGSDLSLTYLYVDAGTAILPDFSGFDAVFMAVGESAKNQPVLGNIERLLSQRNGFPPVMNAEPAKVARLTREGASALLADAPGIVMPAIAVVSGARLKDAASSSDLPMGATRRDISFPVAIRPVGTHAGEGLERIMRPADLEAYLRRRPAETYHLAPFIDYSGPDGRYRKQRVAFIDGKAFASHYAVSEHWIVHYLSSGMAEHAWRRAEEERWMENFDTDFAVRHAEAFEGLCSRVGLDYFGIDCAEMPDGRLLVFEVDVAMIVHDMDPEEVFPYKKPAMRKLFTAFQDALKRRAASAGSGVCTSDQVPEPRQRT